MSRVLPLLLLFAFAGSASAQGKAEPLVLKVKISLRNGIENLIKAQRDDGSWEVTVANNDREKLPFVGGSTGLSVLALLNCEQMLDPSDPLEQQRKQAVIKGLNSLRKLNSPDTVYVRSLQTMAFAEARMELPTIKQNVQWLLDARVYEVENKKKYFKGWDYFSRPGAIATDASNSQYAMLALWYARQAGVEVPRDAWKEIYDYYRRTQHKEGFWNYSSSYDRADLKAPSVSMTIAGLCGLYIAGSELNEGREQWQKNGRFTGCGEYGDDPAIAKALEWLSGNPLKKIPSHFTLEPDQRIYYHLYGLERAGRLSGMRFFGEHDWYREGCELLVSRQAANGGWPKGAGHDQWPHVNTAFALLFLSKGRTPVVVSKLVHGNWPRREDDTDWNNDRNDLRHLTEYVARDGKLFGKKPLAWQTYDIMRALYSRSQKPTIADELAIVADMRQSPILYITGHNSPLRRIQEQETTLIKRFVENGGFLFAEACCGDPDFDKGIKAWVEENWPGHQLTYLESTHPVWTCHHTLQAGEPFKLMGLQVGCRTIMLYSPQDLSCHWESNRTTDGASKRAFELGANILAYGTGRIPPQPRLTPIELAMAPKDPGPKSLKRGYLQVGQIYFKGDWQPAPNAMNNVLTQVNKVTGLDVRLKTERIFINNSPIRSRFLYMHGREPFAFQAKDVEQLRFALESGCLLLADACCGNEAFDKSFRQFVQILFPKEKLVTLSTDPKSLDRLYSRDFNDEPLTAANIKCRPKTNANLQSMAPHLEGIQINGRWVLLYSKYDLGCALEGHTSPDCVGYDQPSALKLATAAMLYDVRP